jgi:hypothetical protein
MKGRVSIRKGDVLTGCGSFEVPVLVQRVACITGVSIPQSLRLVGREADLFNRFSGWMDTVSGGSAPGDQYRSLPAAPAVGRRRHSAVSVATSLRAGLPRFQKNNKHGIRILNIMSEGHFVRCWT